MDYFTRFNREKTPQNNFFCQNFIAENNYKKGEKFFWEFSEGGGADEEIPSIYFFRIGGID